MDTTDPCCFIPCLGCLDDRAIAIRRRLGALYLQLEQKQLPEVPTRSELLRGCCRHIRTVEHAPLVW
jgi:hypothetical protein